MKPTIFLIGILAFIGAGCANQPPVVSQEALETSMEVPASGFVNVEETIVSNEEPVNAEVENVPNTQSAVPSEDAAVASDVASFTVVARQWAFEPSIIRVRQGQNVSLTIRSVDVSHGFSLSAFNVNEQLEPGQTVYVSFVADTKGSYPFFCSVFCGQGHSVMRGTLIVE